MSSSDIQRMNKVLAKAMRPLWEAASAQQAISAEVTRPFREAAGAQQAAFAELTRPFREAASAQQAGFANLMRPFREAASAQQAAFAKLMRPFREAASAQQAVFAELTRPFREAASLHRAVLRDMVESLQAYRAAAADSLRDYTPDIHVDGDNLTVDGEAYDLGDINRIEQQFLNSKTGVLAKSPSQVVWEQIPPAIRFVIKAILSALISIILQYWFCGIANKPLLQLRHEREVEVRRLARESARSHAQEIKPFVNTERLPVHAAPKRQSRVLAVLAYPQHVTILEYGNKKRWIRIEWRDPFGESHSGWVLGRYVYRVSGRREVSDE